MLLPRGEGEAETPKPVLVERLPDNPSRHAPYIFRFDGHVSEIRPAVVHGIPERLPFSDGYVRSEFARRTQKRERQGFGRGDYEKGAAFFGNSREGFNVLHASEKIGLLDY